MDSAYTGEIRAFPYNFTPAGWLFCDGSKVDIRSYQMLYAVIGGQYGDTDGRTYFSLPNLQGMVPMGANPSNSSKRVGQKGGNETVTLTINNIPTHKHTAYADKRETSQQALATNIPDPTVFLSNMVGTTSDKKTPSIYSYVDVTPQTTEIVPNDALIGPSSENGLPHNNMMPYLPMRLCICYNGVFPIKE